MGIGYRNREQYADPTPFFALRGMEEKQNRRTQAASFSPLLQTPETETPRTPDEQLSIAIVCQAADDYRTARRALRRNAKDREAEKLLLDAEDFFRGDWIRMLTRVPGTLILRRLAAEFDSEAQETQETKKTKKEQEEQKKPMEQKERKERKEQKEQKEQEGVVAA